MFTTIWEFEVDADTRDDFVRVYGPAGAWVQLFRTAAGFRETILLQDIARPERLVTLDRWDSRAAWDAFRQGQHDAYTELDLVTGCLARTERHLGTLEDDRG
jgi:heme-degrading monooxygenase HmoA